MGSVKIKCVSCNAVRTIPMSRLWFGISENWPQQCDSCDSTMHSVLEVEH